MQAQATTEFLSHGWGTSGNIYLRKGKALNSSDERSVRNSPATPMSEKEGEGASGTRAEISLQPMVEIQLEERKSMRKEQQREAVMD